MSGRRAAIRTEREMVANLSAAFAGLIAAPLVLGLVAYWLQTGRGRLRHFARCENAMPQPWAVKARESKRAAVRARREESS